jgi:hypothetical protein
MSVVLFNKRGQVKNSPSCLYILIKIKSILRSSGTPINQECDDFKIEFSSVNGGLSIVMSGNMKPVCFGAWITVATNVPVFIPSGSQCPTDGEIVSKAGGNTARVVIKSDSQIEIYFNDALLKTYYDCEEIEGICVG